MNHKPYTCVIPLVLLALVISGCGITAGVSATGPTEPASVYCKEQGHTLEIGIATDGGECELASDSEVSVSTPEAVATETPTQIPTRTLAPVPTRTPAVGEISDRGTAKENLVIHEALAAHLGASVNELSIVINENTGSHARGGVENGYFLAARVNGQWFIVADGQGALDCQVLAQYGFPPSMVPECQSMNGTDRLVFKPGGTYTFVQRSIGAGERHVYVLRALAGQTMIVSAASPHNDVFVGIKGIQGGRQLLSGSLHAGSWTGTLPQTQDYEISLTTDNPDTDYLMDVEIPANVRFEPGAYSTIIDGHIEVFDASPSIAIDNHVTYLLYASAGQRMDVQLSSPSLDALSLGIYGQTDGQPYQRYQVKNSGFNGVLPLTQGYYLKVFSTGTSTDFTLTITIT